MKQKIEIKGMDDQNINFDETCEQRYLNFYNVVKSYYEDLDSLVKRLQDDYAGTVPFEQMEEDRLGLCYILDLIDEMERKE